MNTLILPLISTAKGESRFSLQVLASLVYVLIQVIAIEPHEDAFKAESRSRHAVCL